MLIALGLAVCFRSNVWNIGAEGQFMLGAIGGGGVALLRPTDTGRWIVLPRSWSPARSAAWLWAAIAALLRDRFNANEILVSLMLVYVAELLLRYLVYGPWKDPAGYNFPQIEDVHDGDAAADPCSEGTRLNIGAPDRARRGRALAGCSCSAPIAGFQLQVGGLAPAAARYAGFSARSARSGSAARSAARAPAWPGAAKSPGRSASSRRTCRPATASPRSSSPSSAGCTRSASCFASLLMTHVLHRRRAGAVALGAADVADRRVPGPAAVLPARPPTR